MCVCFLFYLSYLNFCGKGILKYFVLLVTLIHSNLYRHFLYNPYICNVDEKRDNFVLHNFTVRCPRLQRGAAFLLLPSTECRSCLLQGEKLRLGLGQIRGCVEVFHCLMLEAY